MMIKKKTDEYLAKKLQSYDQQYQSQDIALKKLSI